MEEKIITPALRQDVALRIEKIQEAMRGAGCGALLVSSNSNLYYASGRIFRGYVYVPVEGEAVNLVIRPFGIEGSDVAYIRKPEQIVEILAERGVEVPLSVGLELDSLTVNDYSRLRKALGGGEMRDISGLLRSVREVKTPYEISLMREDGRHHVEVYRRIPGLYTENMTDLELQIEIEHCLRLEGCLGFTRMSGQLMEINMGSVLAGDNADVPGPYDFSMGGAGVDLALPVGADGSVMREGTTVMVDMNGNFNGYQTDLTRVWRLGNVSGVAERAHNLSIAILRRLEKISMPGLPVSEMAAEAYSMVEKEGLLEYFMGHRQQAGFIGHGVGIQLNELPVIMTRSKEVLAAGMTLAIEPKFVIPGVGAVGVENTYLVTPDGLENLTPAPEGMTDLL